MSTEEQVTPAPTHENPGQVLKARREAMGWSVEQIADQLKLAPRQVVALEAGDYDALPPAAVVRGFVRGYAKVVKIDAAPLVAAIPVDAAAAAADASAGMRRERVAAPLPRVRYPSHGKRSRFPMGVVVGLVGAAAGVGVALYFLGMLPFGAPVQPAPATTGADGTLTEPVAAPALPANGARTVDPALQQQSVPLISVPPPAPDPSAPAGTAPVPPSAAPVNPPAATPPATTQQPAAQPPVTTRGIVGTTTTVAAPAAAAGGALVLNVKQDSWIEVRGSGKPLISRLVKAGSTETVNINEPVTLVVGNPAGVQATLRGAALALPQPNGRTVSRQTLK